MDREKDSTVEEDTPIIPPSEATARYYFELTYQLCGEDITKFDRLNELNVYLCLNTASLIKDRIIKEKNELKKLESEMKKR